MATGVCVFFASPNAKNADDLSSTIENVFILAFEENASVSDVLREPGEMQT